jgi:hypothetical protein
MIDRIDFVPNLWLDYSSAPDSFVLDHAIPAELKGGLVENETMACLFSE